MTNIKLDLSADEMRTLGANVMREVIEHFSGLPSKPLINIGTRAELEAALREPLPEYGTDPLQVMARLREHVWNNIIYASHPRFFAFVPTPSNFVSAMADALMAGYDPISSTWIESSGPAVIELVTIDWLREMCGMPATAGGHFVTGGSAGNLTGLAVARHIQLDDDVHSAVVYCSDQTHFSAFRARWLLGFKPDQLVKIESDKAYCLPLQALTEKIANDRAAGKRPFCIIANAGSTNTGSVDPLDELADLSAHENLWLHVDGAYGAAAMLTEHGRTLLHGIGRAHSLALDPHKWLFQPYECGVVLVREARWLRETFSVSAEYLTEAAGDDAEINFYQEGTQLTRSFKALKLWFSFQVFGAASFRAAIEHGITLAEHAENVMRSRPYWEILAPARLGIVAFRYTRPELTQADLNLLNQSLVTRNLQDGYSFISSTTLRGRTTLRLCPINPHTTREEIENTMTRLEELARDL